MSLIHWWPLNGDTKDYGIENSTLTNNGATADNAGKIGKCYSFDGTNDRISSTTSESIPYPISISAWFYPTNVSSTTTQYAFSYNKGNQGTAGHAIGFGFLGSVRLCIWAGGNTYQTDNLSNNTWYHIAITIDANKKMIAYINGIQKYTTTVNNHPGSTWFTLGARSNSSSGGSSAANYYFKGKINDARVYNHALSLKEIKELSKGLMLHYNFENAELSKNLLTTKSLPTYTTLNTKANYTIIANSTTFFGLSVGDTYCWSLYVNVPTDRKKLRARVQFYNSNSDRTSTTSSNFVTNGEGFIYVSGQVLSGYNRMDLMIDYNSSIDVTTTNIPCYYKFAKLEKGRTVPTSWTLSSEESIIYDNSGYNNNAIKVNDTGVIVNGGPVGNNYFKSDTYHTPYRPNPNDIFNSNTFTISAWLKFNAKGKDKWVITLRNFEGTGFFNFGLNGGSEMQFAIFKNDLIWQTRTSSVTASQWTYWVGTFDGTTAKLYKNGIVISTATSRSYATQTPTYSEIGGRYKETDGTYYDVDCDVADIKLYATALSASDVKAEYNRKASIDNQGNLYTGLFEQNTTNIALPTKTGIVKANHFVEGGNKTSLQESYIELEYIESTGTQWINTGIKPTNNTIIEAELYTTSTNNKNWFGADGTSSTTNFVFNAVSSTQVEYRYGNTNWTTINYSSIVNNKFYIFYGTKGLIINNNVLVNQMATNTFTSTYNLCIFIRYNNSAGIIKGRVYSFKITEGSALIRDFIPAKRKSDNTIGLYDIINKVFYTNQGTGTFTAGPEVNKLNVIYTNELKEI